MTVLWIVVGIVLGYGLLMLIVYVVQEFFFFQPEKLPHSFRFEFGLPFDELFFDTIEGGRINALHFKVSGPKGVIYFCKGNSKSIKGWAKMARDFTSKGYDVLIFDYRGFGKSKGKRSEENLYFDIQFLYDWLKTQYQEDRIIVYGCSMGTGFATKVASDNQPNMLILCAPYYSFVQLIQRLLPILPMRFLIKYKIRTHRFIEAVTCPVYIFHGTHDWLIPVRYAIQLARKLESSQVKFIPIRGGRHRDLRNFPKYHEHLYHILGFDRGEW